MYKMQSFKLEIGRHFRNDISNNYKGVLPLMGTAPQTPPLPTRDTGGGAEVNSLCTVKLKTLIKLSIYTLNESKAFQSCVICKFSPKKVQMWNEMLFFPLVDLIEKGLINVNFQVTLCLET